MYFRCWLEFLKYCFTHPFNQILKFGNVWDRLIRILWEELQALKHVVAGTVDSQEGSELLM